MKLTTLLLITAILQVSASTFAQKVSLSAKNQPLLKVFSEIRKQTRYDFAFTTSTLNDAKLVTINVENVELKELLDQLFEGQPLEYKVNDKLVVVSKKESSILEKVISRFQSIDIKGKVVDSLNNGLAGATITLKYGKGSTTTLANGDFTLKRIDETSTLVVSYLGYVTKEVKVNAEFNYIQLSQSSSKLDEVQIMAYGKTSKRLNTGNIGSLKATDIEKQVINNPLLAIQGRIPGVEVSPQSGLPGAPINILIRGRNSLNQSSNPLFVVDGVPYNNNISGVGSIVGGNGDVETSAFNFLNPNDIESIDILKDADATSIYGSRGSNGVVLITTKKGQVGKDIINVSAQSGFSEVPRKLSLLSTNEYLEMRIEALKNDNRLARLDNPTYNRIYPELIVWDKDRYTDWQDKLIGKSGVYNDFNTSISGGSANVQYLIGGSYHNEKYVFPGDAFDRKGNVHFSFSGVSSNQRLRVTLTGSYLVNKNILPFDFTDAALNTKPNSPAVYDASGNINWEPDPNTGLATWQNPYINLLKTNTAATNNIVSTIDASYSILPNLIFKTVLGYNHLQGKGFQSVPLTYNDPAQVKADGEFVDVNNYRNSSFRNNSAKNWSVEPQITYNYALGKGQINVLLGGTLQSNSLDYQQINAFGFSSDAVLQNLSAANNIGARVNTTSQYIYNGVFGRVSYNYSDKYLVNISARRDGSSRFGAGNQFGNFGSAGLAWIFSQERIIKEFLPFLSFGKLRTSYGTSGNDGIGDYRYLELFENTEFAYNGIKGLISNGLSNPYYAWESIRKLEVGLETGFFKDRIVLSTAYFRNRSSNQLAGYPVPAISGPSGNLVANQAALVQNSGIELSLNTINVQQGQLKWSTGLNLSILRNKMLKNLPSIYNGGVADPMVGKPFYGQTDVYVFKGVDSSTGQFQFDDGNGGTTTILEQALGRKTINTRPDFYGGITNSISYKRFALDLFLQFTKQLGENYLYQFTLPGRFGGNQPKEVMSRWKSPSENGEFQRFTTGGINPVPETSLLEAYTNGIKNSDRNWVDASFIRLKNISLSYSLPEHWLHSLNIQSLRIFIQGQNLATLTNYKGFDPETQVLNSLPPLRVITTGIRVTL